MNIIDEALEYQRNGWSVIPILPGTKRPPERFTLSRYFERPATETEIRRWFGSGPLNMAVCLGDVSDGLTVRDFDCEASYSTWTTNYPRLAQQLPTVRTARGRHVYFTSHRSDFDGRQIIPGADGELKRGGYTLLPHSIHPTGKRYEWLIPPNDVPCAGDLLRTGLIPKQANATQEIYLNHHHPVPPSEGFEGLTIEQCIESSQPSGYGERHYCLFAFVRMLKSTSLKNAPQDDLRRPVDRWLTLARPRIRTKDWRTNWIEFLDGWNRVRVPYGATMTAIAERAKGEGIDRLESICLELQRIAGENPFHLDCRTAGKVLGVHYTSAARWLRWLVERGRLRCVRRGDRLKGLASEFVVTASARLKVEQ